MQSDGARAVEIGSDDGGGGTGSLRVLLRSLLLFCGLGAAGLLIRALPGIDHAVFGSGLLRDGLRGRLLFLGIGTLICAVGLPRQAVGFAGGFAYGPFMGTLLASIANLAACLIDLWWARSVARDWARRRLLRGRMARLQVFVSANPFNAILTLRLLPVGSSMLLSLLAGLLGVRTLPFLAASLLGSLPQTVIFVLVGSGTRIGQTTQIALAAGLFVASALLGGMLLRRNAALRPKAP